MHVGVTPLSWSTPWKYGCYGLYCCVAGPTYECTIFMGRFITLCYYCMLRLHHEVGDWFTVLVQRSVISEGEFVHCAGNKQFDTMKPEQHGRHFAADIFKCIFLNENFCILIEIWLRLVPEGLIDNKSALVQVMACRLFGDKPLPESMLTKVCGIIWHY